ncbi:MAG: cytochrome b561 [Granulosicoccus sp.]|jgi:cytochrome b561
MINNSKSYTKVAIILHWLVALGLILNIALALSTDYVGDENIRFVINNHKSIGITLLGFALMRILWRVTHQPPAYPYQQPKLERFAAHGTHLLLYALMLMIPLSGWMHDSAWKLASEIKMYWFGFFEWPRITVIMELEPVLKEQLHSILGGIHTWLSYALYLLVSVHVVAAIMHHYSKTNRVRGRGILP